MSYPSGIFWKLPVKPSSANFNMLRGKQNSKYQLNHEGKSAFFPLLSAKLRGVMFWTVLKLHVQMKRTIRTCGTLSSNESNFPPNQEIYLTASIITDVWFGKPGGNATKFIASLRKFITHSWLDTLPFFGSILISDMIMRTFLSQNVQFKGIFID